MAMSVFHLCGFYIERARNLDAPRSQQENNLVALANPSANTKRGHAVQLHVVYEHPTSAMTIHFDLNYLAHVT